MKLTNKTNYAVRILMYCAANEGRLSRTAEIAKAYGISQPFLFHILRPLTEAGLVETIRGRNGGVRLGRAASEIDLLDVVTVTEDSFSMAECSEEDTPTKCPLTGGCGFHSALSNALYSFLSVLQQHSIQDLISIRPGIRRRLGIEPQDFFVHH